MSQTGDYARERFTGHEREEEVGLDYMQARRYVAEFGRFLSVDPLADEFAGWTPYNYVMNNPVRLVDPTGQAAECPDCDFLSSFKYALSKNNTFLGRWFRADQQGQLEQEVAQDLSDAGNATVGAVDNFADKASDGSTWAVIGGIGLVAGGAAVTYYSGGIGSSLGAGMIETGLTITGTAFTIGTAADVTSTVAKGIDAAAFDGSSDAFMYQSGETLVNALGARYLPRAGAATVRYLETATQATRRVPASFGLRTTVNVATDATRVALPLLLFDQ